MRRVVIVLLVGVLGLAAGMPVRAQGDGEHPVITPENADRLVQIGQLGRGWINAVAWSPDGSVLAVGSSNGVYLYDASDWDAPPRELPGYTRAVMALAWHPSENRLVTLDSDGALRLWQVSGDDAEEREIHQPELPPSEGWEGVYPNAGYGYHLAYGLQEYSENDAIYVVVSLAPNQYVIWNAAAGYYVGTSYTVVADTIPISDDRWTVTPYFIELGENAWIPLKTWLTFDPAHALLAVVDCGDAYAGSPVCRLGAGTAALYRLGETEPQNILPTDFAFFEVTPVFSVDGSALAVGGCRTLQREERYCDAYGVDVVTVKDGVFDRVDTLALSLSTAITSMAFSPDARYVAAADARVVIVHDLTQASPDVELAGYGGPVIFLAAQPGSPVILSGHDAISGGHGTGVNAWTLESLTDGEPLWSLPGGGPLAFNGDGSLLATGDEAYYFDGARTEPSLWRIDGFGPGRILNEAVDALNETVDLEFDSQGRLFASVDFWRLAVVDFDAGTTQILDFGVKNTHFDLSPDGRYLALEPGGSLPFVFETETFLVMPPDANMFHDLAPVLDFRGSDPPVYSVHFTPDNQHLIAIGKTEAQVWQIDPIAEVMRINSPLEQTADAGHNEMVLGTVAFAVSPDSRLMAFVGAYMDSNGAPSNVGIWLVDLGTGDVVAELDDYGTSVRALAFSSDGRLLYSGSGSWAVNNGSAHITTDNRIRVWAVPAD
jgi:WD40 repeat protein